MVLKDFFLIQTKDSVASAKVAEHVRTALSDLPSQVLVKVSPKTLSMLKDAQENLGKGGKYEPSHNILEGILKALNKEIKTDLQATIDTEKGLDEDYEDLMHTKYKEVNELQKSIAAKEKRKAEAEVELAAASQEYDDTDAQMRRDVEFFDEMKESCEDKESQWTEREDLRNSELDGIKEALDILTSDEAREMFAKAIKPGMETFIQIEAEENDPVKAVAEKAYNVVRLLSGKADDKKAIQFAKLAVSIRESNKGKKGARDQFKEVLAEIDKIIENLKDEAKDDEEKRDECHDTYQEIASTVADLNWKIEKNEAKIAKLEDMIAEKEKEKEKTIQEIEDVEKEIEEMEDQRKSDKEAYEEAKSDDENAVELLHQARDALKKFYEDNDIDMGELQEPALLAKWGITKTKKEPEFERDEHDDPDAEFSDKGNRKTQSKGILSLLSMIAEDLEDEIKNSEKAEESAIETFEKELKLAKELKGDLVEKKEGIEDTIDKHTSAKDDEHDDMGDNEDSKESEFAYKADIKKDCDFIIKAFHYRRERRDMEIDGLTKAKAMLRGAAPGAFLEKTPVKAHLRH